MNLMKELIKKFIPDFLLSWYHFTLAFLGAVLYGFPGRKIKVIGVTGTNGKTTTVNLINQILEIAGFKVASMSSIKFKIGNKEWENKLKMTMPGRFFAQKLLRKAVSEKCDYFVLEVTSEGIKQYRHKFIDFKAAVLTNLTPEHIEAHGGFENYKIAKGKLFKATKGIHIINIDDENAKYFLQFPAEKKYGYAVEGGFASLGLIEGGETSLNNRQDIKLNLKLMGEFNKYNALAAICVGLSQGINLDICKRAVEKVEGIPGRMEEVISEPFKVFVDYAFTPNALGKVYQTLKPKNKKMICVLGACGGGRDKWKRPVLGGIAGKYCDEVIVTNEDPYNENPMEIVEQVAKNAGSKAKKILDRREAIKEALKTARSGDVVIFTGKGSEPWICLSHGKKMPWNEKEIIKEEYEKIRNFRA